MSVTLYFYRLRVSKRAETLILNTLSLTEIPLKTRAVYEQLINCFSFSEYLDVRLVDVREILEAMEDVGVLECIIEDEWEKWCISENFKAIIEKADRTN